MRRAWRWAVLFALLCLPLLLGASSLLLTLLAQTAATAVVCLGVALLMGQGGLVSFGHAVYSGLGGFAVLHALNGMAPGHSAAWVLVLPILGAAAGTSAAAVLAWLCTRQAGLGFAMITMGLGELVYAGALMWPAVFGGEAGVRADRAQGTPCWGLDFAGMGQVYGLVLVYAVAAAALAARFPRTPSGLVLRAVRDNPGRAAGLGQDPQRLRWTAMVIAGGLAGLGGGLLALVFESVSAEAMSGQRSGLLMLFTFMGGSLGLAGPLLGAALLVFSSVWLSVWTAAWGLYVGGLFLGMVMFAPQGLVGLRLRPAAWRQLLPAALAAAGAVTLVEMAYHRWLNATLGPVLHWAGLVLDTGQPAPWGLAAALLVVGAWGLRGWRP
jgi:branched-chain amino acid transport system permease protein